MTAVFRPATRIFNFVEAPAPRLLMRLALIEKLVEQLPPQLSSFIEIGPGLGDMSAFLVSRFPEINGCLMDISEVGTDALEKRFASTSGIRVAREDFRSIAGIEPCDLVVACEVFEHLDDDEVAFHAVHKMLKPDGYFIFSVPAFMRKWGAADEYAGHFRRYERGDMLEKFRRHGFEVKEVCCYGFPLINILNVFSGMYYRMRLTKDPVTMMNATKRSGTDRHLVDRFSGWPVAWLLTPFFYLQAMARHYDIGDGYLILARKLSGNGLP